MAQLGARLNGIEKVVGSNPTGSTKFIRNHFYYRFLKEAKAGVLSYLAASWEKPGGSPAKVFAEHVENLASRQQN
jgi:hypothetical protein